MISKTIVMIGVIIIIFGIVFNFQGNGTIGPETSFMYENEEWNDYGMFISMIGVILILIGYIVEKKRSA
jgi:hypothetical protein|tara:strand:+ start:189 stop:395 length:207 start_codon:yes stop_codon:yes gene_type:complete